MRGIRDVWIIWVLSLPLFVLALQELPVSPLDKLERHKSHLEELRSAEGLDLAAIPKRNPSSSVSAPSETSAPSTPSSFNSSSSTLSSSSTKTTPATTTTNIIVIPSSVDDSGSSSSTSPPENSGAMSIKTRNLIIILSSVLGTFVIALVAVAICLTCRYRKRKAPFRDRGVTPIDDDEIESWREPKQSPVLGAMSPHTPRGLSIDSIALKHSPAWTWNASPDTINAVPQTPDFVARAPNSRVGLTDEAIPGAAPFVSPPKRQSSRLSKAPRGHGRTKSRRSSMSGKSVRSYTGGPAVEPKPNKMPNWYDPDDESVAAGLRDTDHSSPATSIFDGLSVGGGGLSPRPKSKSQLRPWDPDYGWDKDTGGIGRAIA